MKKILVILILLLGTLSVNARRYGYAYTHDFHTYSLGIGYTRFNESHASSIYDVKNNQIQLYSVICGFYMDASFGFNKYSPSDDDYFGTWGMDFGYLFPMNKKNLNNTNLYFGPVIGFQRIGEWYSDDYFDPYYGHFSETSFCTDKTYMNYGIVLGLSYRHLWMQGKITRTTCGIGIGYKF